MARFDGRKRPYTIGVTCSEDEKKIIEEKANRVGLSKSAYIRWLVFGFENSKKEGVENE